MTNMITPFRSTEVKANIELMTHDITLTVIAPAGFWPLDQNPRRHYRNPRVIENMYAITRKNLES